MTMISMKRRMEQLEADSPDNVSSFHIVFRDECDPGTDEVVNASREQVIVTTFVASEYEWTERLTHADPTVSNPAWAYLDQLAESFSAEDAAKANRQDTRTPIERMAWAFRFDPQRYPIITNRVRNASLSFASHLPVGS